MPKLAMRRRNLIRRIGEVLGTAFIENAVKQALLLQANGGLTDREGKHLTSINTIFKSLVHAALEDNPQAWDKAFHTPLPSHALTKSSVERSK